MGIDDIKPPGGFPPLVNPTAETPVAPKRESKFASTRDKLRAPSTPEIIPGGPGVAAQFTQSALRDPGTLENVVRELASQLIDSGQGATGALSSADRESLLNFLSGDPLIRGRIETYLRKVLT